MEQPPNSPPVIPPVQRKSGRGCLTTIVYFSVLAFIVVFVTTAIFAPWGFFMGGHFHIFPGWTGWGKLHSNSAGDYALYVSIFPATRGRGGRGGGGPRVKGSAVLCTPRGEKYNLRVNGDFEKNPGINLQGKTAALYVYNYSVFSTSKAPSLEFRGKWNNPDLVLDDHGSITRAFDPGGVLVTNPHTRPYIQEVVPLTLHVGTRADFDAACALVAKH
ncbi:MAG: hypothetical protein WA672_06085 [Candidatus Angelobacter sp.]